MVRRNTKSNTVTQGGIPFMTSNERDSIVSVLEKEAERECSARDDEVYESDAYWMHHDRAIRWMFLVEQFLPKSSRTIDPNHVTWE